MSLLGFEFQTGHIIAINEVIQVLTKSSENENVPSTSNQALC